MIPMTTQFPHAYVINVMSDDHPGIIAAVSGVVSSLGGNIDACSQTVLSGYFTLIMVVSFPHTVSADDLAKRIRGSQNDASLQVVARAFQPGEPAGGPARPDVFVVTAFGKDKPGIIHRFSEFMAGKDINIGDMYWVRTNDDFTLVCQVEIPHAVDIGLLQADLEHIGQEVGFNVRLQHENIFVATNQLRLKFGPKTPGHA